MPWTSQAKSSVLRNERQSRTYGISRAEQMVMYAPEKKGYLPALELDHEDIKNVTHYVHKISPLSPFLC